MARPAQIPPALMIEPFHVAEAAALGVSQRRLAGRSYRRLLPGVWAWSGLVMTEPLWWVAARKYAPSDARFTGATRLQQLGLDLGPHRPLQMVVGRDLHRSHPDVFLHRSERLPLHDDDAVCAEAVFVEVCRWFSVLDAVAAGDFLLAHGHMSRERLAWLVATEPWREGVEHAAWVARMLDGASRSVPESNARMHMLAAGLPRPEVNVTVEVGGTLLTPDWWWRRFRVAAEYEGTHHQVWRTQYVADIDRYQLYRRAGVRYQQITKELASRPSTMVRRLHDLLVGAGYSGPAPATGAPLAVLLQRPAVAMADLPDLPVWRTLGR